MPYPKEKISYDKISIRYTRSKVLKMKVAKSLYFKYFNWLIANKEFKVPEERQEFHRLLCAVLSTALLMWSYALNAYFCIPSPLLVKIGFIGAILHFLSPLVFKLTGSAKFTTHFFIAVGFIFQTSHAFYTGGFLSNTIIWFSLLPLIAAIILGKGALVFWSIIAVSNVISLYFLNDYTVDIISNAGQIWAQLNIAIGYILVNFVLMFMFIYFKDWNKKLFYQKNESIKRLLRIVSHDIANPLMIIIGKTSMIKVNLQKKIDENRLTLIKKHCDSVEKSSLMIKEILDHTRSLDVIDTGNKEMIITEVPLNEIIENSLFVFKEKLEDKKIKVIYDFKENEEIHIKAESISIRNQVFNNLFSNSIKFMNTGGAIQVLVDDTPEHTEVIYSDNGIGMSQEIIKNLFRTDFKTTEKGVRGETGTGFGMPILYSTLLQISATVEVESYLHTELEEGEISGTIFKMKFFK
jgi:signal transduction histidine kinase